MLSQNVTLLFDHRRICRRRWTLGSTWRRRYIFIILL